MGTFDYKNGQLTCGGIAIADIEAKVGTPFFVYDLEAIEAEFKSLSGAFKSRDHTIAYAVKANSNLALLKFLNNLGCGFDAAR